MEKEQSTQQPKTEIMQSQGEFQQNLAELELPQTIVFLDVNGTLFADESRDGYISEEYLCAFQEQVTRLQEQGISIGLNSDSPLPQLQELAVKLGIFGPIIAENGNLISHNGKTIVINQVSNIKGVKAKIRATAAQLPYHQIQDCIAPEFGGDAIDVHQAWSFGANRQTSVTVFGPEALIHQLHAVFENEEDYGIDNSAEYSFFAVHPGKDYRSNKGKTLNILSSHGYNIIMIGNSKSDWVEPTYGVQCAFVQNARIDQEIEEQAVYVSLKPLIKGVVDILSTITPRDVNIQHVV